MAHCITLIYSGLRENMTFYAGGNKVVTSASWTDPDRPTPKPVDCVLSIDELEEKTGIDFFPNVNDKLENALEATYSTKAWQGLESNEMPVFIKAK